jgi:hypothetical protein
MKKALLLVIFPFIFFSTCDLNSFFDTVTLDPVPLTADVVTTSQEVGSGKKYHRPENYYNGKLCRTIQHSTLYHKNHQTAISEGFGECSICKPNSRITVEK